MTIDDEKTADEVEVIAEDPAASTEDSVQPLEPDAITDAPEKAAPQGRAGASFVALFAGGLVAGFIGFGLGRFDQTSGWIFPTAPDVGAENSARIGDLEAKTNALSASLDGAFGELSAIPQAIAENTTGFARQDDVLAAQNEVTQALARLSTRLQDLENRPIPDIGATQDAVDAYETELAAMREMFAQELNKIRATQEQALIQQTSIQAQTRSAAFEAATNHLAQLAASGADLADTLDQLRDQNVSIPPVLETHSNGISSLNGLRASFPDAARATLTKEIERQAEAGEISGLQAFMKKQLGARSVEPKEGTDPDAILARAEAELAAGNLDAAVNELSSLQELGADELQNWISRAQTHLDVLDAIRNLQPNNAQ